MQVRRRLAHLGVAIVAASAGLTAWSSLASAGDTADKGVFVSQTDSSGHGPGGCKDGAGPSSADSL